MIFDRRRVDPTTLIQPYPGPQATYDPETGSALIGIHADATPARWRLFHPAFGLASGLIAGGTGSGTTTLLATIAATAAHTGVLSVWAADLQDGASVLTSALDHTPWAAHSPGRILHLLDAANWLIDTRVQLNALRRRAVHIPTPDEPGVLFFLDKITNHDLFTRRSTHTQLAARIAGEGRKAAVGLVVATDDASLAAFGDNAQLRTDLAALNLAGLHTYDPLVTLTWPELPADPRTLPPGRPGLGYLATHPTPFRGWYSAYQDTHALFANPPALALNPLNTPSARATGRARR